jgi:hypothetical protein
MSMTCRGCTFGLVVCVVGAAAVLPAVGWRAVVADTTVPAGTLFVPKSRQERAAFNAAVDEKERIADAEEKESRATVLPTLVHPFNSPVTHPEIGVDRAAIHMRDGVKLRGSVYRPKQDGRYPVILQAGPYDMDQNLDEMPALFRNLARRGYAVVTGGPSRLGQELPEQVGVGAKRGRVGGRQARLVDDDHRGREAGLCHRAANRVDGSMEVDQQIAVGGGLRGIGRCPP